MLPKKLRANTKEVERIFKGGRALHSESLSFKFLKNDGREAKISFIAPKSIAKLAVKRNLLRRRGYSVLKKCIKDSPPGITGVFIFKKYQEDVSILEYEIKSLLHKVN